MTQLLSLERWALLPFGVFLPNLLLVFSEPVIFRNLYHVFVASVGTFSGSFLFYRYFSVPYFGLQSMSRFTGLQFTGLPCLPVFFFRATPSPRFTGGMPVYRGGSFFHARGAPPAAAHSHTRCCTKHNTTRWVLRAAANTCLHTMPCAAGELCQLSDSTTTPEFSCCGPCGGRLHRCTAVLHTRALIIL